MTKEYLKLISRTKITVEPNEVIALRFHENIKNRFYRSLVLATTVKSKLEILNSGDFFSYIESALSKVNGDGKLQSYINYFQKVSELSEKLYIEKIRLTKYITNADQALKDRGYYTPETQCSALMWTNRIELMEVVTPTFPIITAIKETGVRLSLLTIAEILINYMINLIDSWDGSMDYPDLQKYLVPIVYAATIFILLGKGVFDYRANQNSLVRLDLELGIDEADTAKFDRDIAARVVIIADRIQSERELRGPQLA